MNAPRTSMMGYIGRAVRRKPPMLVRAVLLIVSVWAAVQWSGLYSGPGNKVIGVVATCLLFLVVGSLGRVVHGIFSLLFVLLLILQITVEHFYGPPDYQLFLSLRYTTMNEASGYMSDLLDLWGIFFGAMLILFLCIFLIKIRIAIHNKLVVAGSAVLLVALPVFRLNTGKLKVGTRTNLALVCNEVPTKIVANALYYSSQINDLFRTKDRYDSPYDWSAFADLKPKRLNIVLVGESSRADLYGVNGFRAYDLTPNIDSTYSYNFGHCYSQAAHTIGSLTRTLFLTDSSSGMIPEANLVALLRAKGVRTFWVSNQGFVGQNDSPISALAMGCDSTYFMNKGSWYTSTGPDRVMLPTIQRIIGEAASSDLPTCLFIHLIGSHPPLDRGGKIEGPAYGNNHMLAGYMRSIRETDDLIGKVLREAGKVPDHNVFYFSDHGIAYEAKGNYFVHCDKYLENYWVPFMIWSSSDHSRQTIDRQLTLNSFMGIFQYFNTGDTTDLNGLLNVIKPPGIILDSDNKPIDLQARGRNRIDL